MATISPSVLVYRSSSIETNWHSLLNSNVELNQSRQRMTEDI
jgi:hypothetical protein